MKNTFGQSVSVTLFGESHGAAIGAVIDGLSPGISVDTAYMAEQLSKRRPASAIDTARREQDAFHILSGVFDGKTTGTPICILIPNEDKKSADYADFRGVARPSHADYSAYCKYHGFEDYRGGGHFSGRITAALVASGAILLTALANIGISVSTHILCCAGVYDRPFDDIERDISTLKHARFPVLDEACEEKMTAAILEAKKSQDSVGGIVQTAVWGMPSGVGEPWFDSMEGVLSHALFSIGGVKGVEFGAGFSFAEKRASACNDSFRVVNGKVVTVTNHNGGINGGITNGMPILFNCAVKPTPSIAQEQKTVHFIKNENTDLQIRGRHDPAIVRRICPVVDSVAAIVLCDMLAQRYGTDVFVQDKRI